MKYYCSQCSGEPVPLKIVPKLSSAASPQKSPLECTNDINLDRTQLAFTSPQSRDPFSTPPRTSRDNSKISARRRLRYNQSADEAKVTTPPQSPRRPSKAAARDNIILSACSSCSEIAALYSRLTRFKYLVLLAEQHPLHVSFVTLSSCFSRVRELLREYEKYLAQIHEKTSAERDIYANSVIDLSSQFNDISTVSAQLLLDFGRITKVIDQIAFANKRDNYQKPDGFSGDGTSGIESDRDGDTDATEETQNDQERGTSKEKSQADQSVATSEKAARQVLQTKPAYDIADNEISVPAIQRSCADMNYSVGQAIVYTFKVLLKNDLTYYRSLNTKVAMIQRKQLMQTFVVLTKLAKGCSGLLPSVYEILTQILADVEGDLRKLALTEGLDWELCQQMLAEKVKTAETLLNLPQAFDPESGDVAAYLMPKVLSLLQHEMKSLSTSTPSEGMRSTKEGISQIINYIMATYYN
eukprot:TRINITY_DN2603_c0_g2_i1.p1 TRINITY_DN2603_c0_g2~~TRINITY_DN2603_c0_g2_i1.p1  ORF type:complete len:469 (+),score=92.23 TRINITY_DN2603_c0_g2_i1:269-1675(+)